MTLDMTLSGQTQKTGVTHGVTGKNVTAVLGPTNTGKTHLAIQRMLAHDSGLIGLPLRLLAREVYDKIVAQTSPSAVALITGEERIKPANASYYVCTVEAMPKEINVDFVAIDEVQMAADPERGYIFTNRLLHARGKEETLLLGAATMRNVISDLLPGSHFISRPRLSKLTYAGHKKITRLPRRSAIVAFSNNDVYEIAELIRRQRGGAAVVLGALSPRTRNAQVELYQSGDVDFLIATDAIGMGLNLDVQHVAFAGTRKYDGQLHRELTLAEMGQIAGRAGRHTNDGTFGVTAAVEPLEAEVITAMENHEYEPVKVLQWRKANLDFSNLENLKASLRLAPTRAHMVRARLADDVIALENMTLDQGIKDIACSPAALKYLWEICQVPDYRKISAANHAELLTTIYKFIMSESAQIPEDWLAEQVVHANNMDGDIDTLANRITHIRTWTFIAHKHEWLKDPEYWQDYTRKIEDQLSDALHQKLTERFVDQRTSILMKRLRDTDDLFAEFSDDGSLHVEKHYVGRLNGFRFSPDHKNDGVHGKAARNAAAKVLVKELGMRVRRITAAKSDAFSFTKNGHIQWRGEEIACITAGEDPLKPQLDILCDEHLNAQDRDKVAQRLQAWLTEQIETRLQPLVAIGKADDINGLGRGVAFQLCENFGILKREKVAEDVRALDQNARAQLRRYGVRFGAFNIYFPILLKPAAVELLLILWALKVGPKHNLTLNTLPDAPRAGLTSVPADTSIPDGFYLAAGYQCCGRRAVRIDMLERLADMIRPLTSWRSDKSVGEMPKGATGDGGFTTQPEMMSIMGCSGEELASILTSLGFRMEQRLVPPTPKVDEQHAQADENDENNEADKAQETAHGDKTAVDESASRPPQAQNADEHGGSDHKSPAAVVASIDKANTEEAQDKAFETSTDGQGDPSAQPEPALTQSLKQSELESVSASLEEAPQQILEPVYEEVWRPQRRKFHNKNTKRFGNKHTSEQYRQKAKTDQHVKGSKAAVEQSSETEAQGTQLEEGADQKKSQNKNFDRKKGSRKGKKNQGKYASNKKTGQKKSATAEVDPDSPFAALSQLKKDLESRITSD